MFRFVLLGLINFSLISCMKNEEIPLHVVEKASLRSESAVGDATLFVPPPDSTVVAQTASDSTSFSMDTVQSDGDAVTVKKDSTQIHDIAGNPGTDSTQSIQFVTDAKGSSVSSPPTVTGFSFDPISLPRVGSKIQLPASARLTLSTAVTADSVSSGISASVSGTCNPLPTVGTIGLATNGKDLVIPLSGGSCAVGQIFSLQASLAPSAPPVDTQLYALVMPTFVQNPIVYPAASSFVTLFPTKLSFNGGYNPNQVDQCMSAMKAVNAQCTGALPLLSLAWPANNSWPVNAITTTQMSGAQSLPTRYIKYYKAFQAWASLGFEDFSGEVVYPPTIDATLYKPYPTNDPPIISANTTLVATNYAALLNLGLNGTSVGTILTSAGIFPVDGKDSKIPIYEGFMSGGAAGATIVAGQNKNTGNCQDWTAAGYGGVYAVSSTDTTWGQTVHNWCTDISTPYMLCLCWQ